VVVYRYEQGVRPTRANCLSLLGFWGKAFELAAEAKVTAAHPICICQGADRCEFSYSW
jgi:hypothetical protein